VFSDLNFCSIPWPIQYLGLLEIFSIQEGTKLIVKNPLSEFLYLDTVIEHGVYIELMFDLWCQHPISFRRIKLFLKIFKK